MKTTKLSLLAAAAALCLLSTQAAFAQKKYDTGASDTEIKVGNVEAYSGPTSAYAVIGKTEEAYFKMINDQGGINGRKINWISYDDGYSPPKTVEQIRKLIESDEVFLVFNALGTPTQTAVQKYHNATKVPQLFLATGASKWNDPKDFPWTMGFQPSYRVEARIFGKYILKAKPDAKVVIFYANDDFGKDYLVGLKEVLDKSARRLHSTLEGLDVPSFLRDLTSQIYRHPLVHVSHAATILDVAGYVGNFKTTVGVGPEKTTRELEHGVIVIATGGQELKPKEYLHGEDPRVLTQLELERMLAADGKKASDLNEVVMIQCVGSRSEERPYCSRVCCASAVKNALKIKSLNPKARVKVLYRDMRMYGHLEEPTRGRGMRGFCFSVTRRTGNRWRIGRTGAWSSPITTWF